MSDRVDAGALPAFMDFARLGAGYALLWEQARTKHTVHAYLLAGPQGVGKATFARLVAASFFCDGLPKPCGNCDGCGRVLMGNEPDVIEIMSKDDKAISIDRIRQAIAQISQHSMGDTPRFVIIEPVEKMTAAAQNCLLKSLEEPQANVIFFLISHEPSALLGTVASRCAMMKLPPWPDEVVQETLLAMGYDLARVTGVMPRAGGVIGQALALLADESGESELKALIDQALAANGDADVVTLSTRLKDDRAISERALTALEQALHTALLVQTGVLDAQAIHNPQVLAFAQKATHEQLSALLQAVFDTRKWRQSQVNWQASIDRLLMRIVEAKNTWQQS